MSRIQIERNSMVNLFYVEIQYFFLLQKPFQMVSNGDRPDTFGRASKDQVSFSQRDVLGDKYDDVLEGEEQVSGVTGLNVLPVFFQTKVQVAEIAEIFFREQCTDRSRTVKSLGQFPGEAFFLVFLLNIPGGEIHSETDGIVIGGGEFR